ncbi:MULTISPECIES: adenosylcobinamide-phosphate synthase CbiB [unclassified Acidisoma]|uniref:adenosylcobinamide-phosphate synthase CbiB n=1 Tax=unclassified Acidisoma TaxID=2634065 RepID=UPI00352B31A1
MAAATGADAARRVTATALTLTLGAVALEAALGYPDTLFRRIRHPVSWVGALIARLDTSVNDPVVSDARRRFRGVAALLLILLIVVLAMVLLQVLALRLLGRWLGLLLLALFASSLLAQRSLHTHVAAVAGGLERGGVDAGRVAVAQIVGRNPAFLDEAGICRAAIESLAENFSDGVVAPVFWGACCGLPGMATYKAINTADSMIGHRTSRHLAFGWAAARLDDVVNLPASRLSAALLLFAALVTGGDWRSGARAIGRDAGHHRSPNAGWPEAAMAGVLGLRLAGPRVYGETLVEDGWMGDGRAALTAADIRAALRLYRVACWCQAGVLLLLALFLR